MKLAHATKLPPGLPILRCIELWQIATTAFEREARHAVFEIGAGRCIAVLDQDIDKLRDLGFEVLDALEESL